jgi:hypothetical protein
MSKPLSYYSQRLPTGLKIISGFSRIAVGRFPDCHLGDFLHRYTTYLQLPPELWIRIRDPGSISFLIPDL